MFVGKIVYCPGHLPSEMSVYGDRSTALVRSTLLNISESGTPSGLRGILNELVCGEGPIFQNGKENHLGSNKSRNIHFSLTSDDEFCVILS